MSAATLQFADVLAQLRQAKIHCEVKQNRTDGITLEVAVPGQRWELDFLDDGEVEVEVFRSDGRIFDESKIAELRRDFSNGTGSTTN